MNLDTIITGVILLFAFYVVFLVGKFIFDFLHRDFKLNIELVEKDNAAMALSVVGYYIGLVLSIGGILSGLGTGLVDDLIDLALYGILAIILLNASYFVCDKLILNRFKINQELIRDHNQGTGAVVAGVSIASGFIIFGAVSGQGGNLWTATAFWAIGQIILIVTAKIYNLITPYDIHAEIEKDNVAAGVGFAGAIVGMGAIIGLAAEGEFESWATDLPGYLAYAAVGLLLLPVVRFLTDKILLPTVKLSDEIAAQEKPNVGAAYIEAFAYIAAAFVIYWCV